MLHLLVKVKVTPPLQLSSASLTNIPASAVIVRLMAAVSLAMQQGESDKVNVITG